MKAGVTLGSLMQRLQLVYLVMLGSLVDGRVLCAQRYDLEQGAWPWWYI